MPSKKYTVSDGRLVLTLEQGEDGWYTVTSPLHPGVTTQAKSVSEAFEMARDAIALLKKSSAKRP